MNLAEVSIITPSYNQGEFIKRTILSVRKQGYPNIEHIVIDGGSTDDTLEILKKYDNWLVWKSEPDRGQSDAINKGFRMSTGKIIGWLNSDDTYKPGAVIAAVTYLSRHPEVDMVYGDINIIDENDNVIGIFEGIPVTFWKMLFTRRACIPQMSAFFRKEILSEVGLLDVNIQYAMDTDFFVRILRKKKVAYIPKLLANHRWHKKCKSMIEKSKGGETNFTQDRLKIVRKYGIFPFVLYYFRYHVLPPIKRKLLGDRPIFKHKNKKGFIRIFNEAKF